MGRKLWYFRKFRKLDLGLIILIAIDTGYLQIYFNLIQYNWQWFWHDIQYTTYTIYMMFYINAYFNLCRNPEISSAQFILPPVNWIAYIPPFLPQFTACSCCQSVFKFLKNSVSTQYFQVQLKVSLSHSSVRADATSVADKVSKTFWRYKIVRVDPAGGCIYSAYTYFPRKVAKEA